MTVNPYLFVVLECDRLGAGGARYALSGVDEIIVGRGAERGATRQTNGGITRLMVRIPGRSMSSTHARISLADGTWVLEDARSTNGSFVNGMRITRTVLQDADVIELGHTIFLLRGALPTPQATVPLLDSADSSPTHSAMTTLLPSLFAEYATLTGLARSELPILLLGDTGTGKEVLARAVHELSGRAGPFIAVNCGALPPNLVESQMFGHTKGSFSGAGRDEPGIVRSADHGTLLLDEVGDLPLSAQPALLRTLQEREVVPVGGVRPTRVDVRVIAATHQPLERLMQEDRFRRDLFARLDGHRFRLPSLRDRREDLGLIVADILRSSPDSTLRLTAQAGVAMTMYEWPFNIRELVQRMKRAQLLAQDAPVSPTHLALSLDPSDCASRRPPATTALSAEDALRREVLQRLKEHGGNISDVARAMGKARTQIHRWLKRFGIDAGAFRR